MTEDRRSVAEIEAELERQRLALNANLAALKDRITPGGIAQDAMGLLNIPASEAVTGAIGSLASTIRGNPVASLIGGAGLAWLIARPSSRRRSKGAPAETATPALSLPVGTMISAATAIANVVAALDPDDIRAVTAEVDRIARAGAAKLREIDETLREGSRQAHETVAEKAKVATEAAAAARAKLASGLEGLSEEAAAAVIAARESAGRTKRKVKRKANDAYGEVAGLVESHPLAAGAGAAATGALIAALLGAGSGGGKGKRSG